MIDNLISEMVFSLLLLSKDVVLSWEWFSKIAILRKLKMDFKRIIKLIEKKLNLLDQKVVIVNY